MKKVIFCAILLFYFNNSNAQTQETHQGRIIGSYDLGPSEITIVFDEVTLCERKTSPHSKRLFVPNEVVTIIINENDLFAEVLKSNLNEQVYTNKLCQDSEIIEDLIFNVDDEAIVNQRFEVLKNALLDLTKNQIVKEIIRNHFQDSNNNEKIYISELKTKLEQNNINLLDLMSSSLIRNGGTNIDVEILNDNFININLNGKLYDIFIFIPFSDEVNYELNPFVSSTINNNLNKNNINGIQLNSNTIKISELINQGKAKKNQVWFISLSASNNSDFYPALPWQRCKCSRGTKVVDGPTQGISSRGSCSKNGTCNECGRSNIWGTCPEKSCAGC
jgi:hypothetical protein